MATFESACNLNRETLFDVYLSNILRIGLWVAWVRVNQ